MAENFTMHDLGPVATLSEAAVHGYRVRWAVNGDLSLPIVEGVARAFTDTHGDSFGHTEDVREAFLWVSGINEYFLPVRTVMDWMRRGLFVVLDP